MDTKSDSIELAVPFKAEYVSVVRLTASGVANRLGFDIETIEDIKVAAAEVCNKLVNAGSKKAGSYSIVFKISDKCLEIIFDCEDKSLSCLFVPENDELSISIINALMDKVEFCPDNTYLLSMTKEIEENI